MTRTYCDDDGDYAVPDASSPRGLCVVTRPGLQTKAVQNTILPPSLANGA